MKKYATANLILGAISLVYFLVFARMSISMNWLPYEPGTLGIVFGVIILFECILSIYLISFGIVFGFVKKIKIISGVILFADGIVKWIIALLNSVMCLIIVLIANWYPLLISVVIYTLMFFVLAVMNARVRKSNRVKQQ